jgi:GNAT superfamily N-acetyltransferase
LASFFARNVDPEYISHSELQGQRAPWPGEWDPNLVQIVRDEIEPRLAATKDGAPEVTSRPVLVAEENGTVIGLALVTFAGTAPVPFANIEDVIVAPARRGRGIGKVLMNWIATEALARNICRLFLESGINNERAHHFFEREGFHIMSVVMMRSQCIHD